jgi:8-oxo-dGTP diphosphatase
MKLALRPSGITDDIIREISSIRFYDRIEQEHIDDALAWIDSGAPLFRIQKPDTPPKHLVSYFVVLDKQEKKILLVDHKKALLWLPPGGHVDENEHPRSAVIRECKEELGIQAQFLREEPLFLTVTKTVGLTAGHTDVSLWYALTGNHLDTYLFDRDEFNAIEWFHVNDMPYGRSDPHMSRFVKKLKELLENET